MNVRRAAAVAATLPLVLLGAGSWPADAASPGGHCPEGNSGFVLWDTSTEPYAVDNLVDDRGNQNGWACAQPMKVVLDENGEPFQIYNFIDDAGQTH